MGAAQSTAADADVLADLEVLAHGRPLSVLLRSARPAAAPAAGGHQHLPKDDEEIQSKPRTPTTAPPSPVAAADAAEAAAAAASAAKTRAPDVSPRAGAPAAASATAAVSAVPPASPPLVARPDRAVLLQSSSTARSPRRSAAAAATTMDAAAVLSPRTHRNGPPALDAEQQSAAPATPQSSAAPAASAAASAAAAFAPAVPLPRDPDHEFWSALFCDYVVFDAAARPQHRAAFHALAAAAAAAPRGHVSANVALVVRAAMFRVRDYVASPQAAFALSEVLGALLLAARVLSALADTNPSDRTLCLVLGAVPADPPEAAQGAAASPRAPFAPIIPAADAMDMGQSVLWQLLTSALDCISHREGGGEPTSPQIALAAINLVFVALSTSYLAPHNHAPTRNSTGVQGAHSPPLAPAPAFAGLGRSSPSQPHATAVLQPVPHSSPSSGIETKNYLNTADPSQAPSEPTQSILTGIVDKYSRPGAVLATLLDLAVDGTQVRGKNGIRDPTELNSSSSSVTSSASTTAGAMVASLSRHMHFSAPVTPARSPNNESINFSSSQTSPSSFSTAYVMSALTARLPGSNLFFFAPSLWSQDGGASVTGGESVNEPDRAKASKTRTDGSDKMHPTQAWNGDAEVNNTPELDGLRDLAGSDGLEGPPLQLPKVSSPRFISDAPMLLAEQSLALLAVLCSPRERCRDLDVCCAISTLSDPDDNRGTDHPVEQQETSVPRPQQSGAVDLPNPYRAALLSLHDLPPRNIGDDSAYSFSRLYEMLGVWIADPPGALVAYHLIAGNRRFRTFVLARTDPDVILLPLLASMHLRSSGSAPPAPADAYVPSIITLMLSSDADFCAAIDEIVVPLARVPWYENRYRLNGKGISLSSLVMLICIRLVQQSILARRRVIESYLASLGAAIMANVSCAVTGINSLAADRLVTLVDFVAKRRRKSLVLSAHEHNEDRRGESTVRLPRGSLSESVQCTGPLSDTSVQTLSAPQKLIPGQKHPTLNGAQTLVSRLDQRLAGKTAQEHAFILSGFEASEADCIETLSELLGTTLEIVAAILRCRSNVSTNRHLMYALLHREQTFEAKDVCEVSTRTRVVARHIRAAIAFFSSHIDETAREAALPAHTTRDGSDHHVGPSTLDNSSSQAPGSGTLRPTVTSGISVDRVFYVIDRYARNLPHETFRGLPRLRFEFREADSGQSFFLTYSWVLAMRNSTLRWEPSQFPDASIPLFKSVFYPPRPPHGSVGSPAPLDESVPWRV